MTAARGSMKLVAEINALRWNFDERFASVVETGERVAGRPLDGEWEPLVHEGAFGFYQDGVFVVVGRML